MKRRYLLSALVAGGTTGCLSSISSSYPGKLSAYIITWTPSYVTPAEYPNENYTHKYLTEVLKRASKKTPTSGDRGEIAVVQFPSREFEAVKDAMANIPSSAFSGLDQEGPIGAYLTYNQRTIVVNLEKLN